MRITIVTSSLSAGGAERSVVLLSKGFLSRGHRVTVITLHGIADDSFGLSPEIGRVALNVAGDAQSFLDGFLKNLNRASALRKAICATQPEIVISNMSQTNVLTTVALSKMGYPLIIVEHSDPAINARRKVWSLLRRAVYPRANVLVSVSRDIDRYFSWLPESKKTVIPNPINAVAFGEPANGSLVRLEQDKKWIVAMGRLIHLKGFDRLVEAFSRLATKHHEWRLAIAGEGELRSELQEQIEARDLGQRVQLVGFVENPFEFFRRGSLFAMSSRSEGFPYALLEAMASGLPALAMACTSGPGEIIREGIDGTLVPEGDIDAFAGAMDRLMTDEAERTRLAARAKDVIERFGVERIVEQWEALFARILRTDGKPNG